MLTSLDLQNFKSWCRLDSMKFAPITGLFGANSSGKTSILQWLLMLKQTVESADRAQALDLGDERSLVELGTFDDIMYAHAKSEPLKWELSWKLKSSLKVTDPDKPSNVLFRDDGLTFSCHVSKEPTGRLRTDEFAYHFDSHNFVMSFEVEKRRYCLSADGPSGFRFQRTVGRPWELPSPVKCYGFPDQVNSYFVNSGFLADFQLEFEELFSRIYYLGPLREYPKRQYTWGGAQPADMGQRGERVVDALLASRERGGMIGRGKGRQKFTVEEYAAHWLKELGLIHDFKVRRITKNSNLYQVHVQKTPAATPVLITDVGFGVSQILPVLVLCYYVPEGSTIILEQPEIHLHPSVQAGLADVFVDAARVRGIQIIVESHSEHLLRRLQRRVAEASLASENVALYFCEMKHGKSELLPLKLDSFGTITNWPKDFFGDEMGEIAAITKAAMKRQLEHV